MSQPVIITPPRPQLSHPDCRRPLIQIAAIHRSGSEHEGSLFISRGRSRCLRSTGLNDSADHRRRPRSSSPAHDNPGPSESTLLQPSTVEFPSERLGASSNGVPQFGPRRASCPLRPSLPRPCRRRRCASPEPRSRKGNLYMRLRDELGAVFDARGADRHLHGRSRLRLPGRSAEESRRRVDGARPTAGARAGFAHPYAGRGIETGGNPNPTRFLLMIGEAAGARRQQVHLTWAPSGVLRSRPT